MDLKQLERNFRVRDADHPLDLVDRAEFPETFLRPVHCNDFRYLSVWRKCSWLGAPTLRAVLSCRDEDLLCAYRRIWGKSPMWTVERKNALGDITPDLRLSRGELFVIAFYLLGIEVEVEHELMLVVKSKF